MREILIFLTVKTEAPAIRLRRTHFITLKYDNFIGFTQINKFFPLSEQLTLDSNLEFLIILKKVILLFSIKNLPNLQQKMNFSIS